MSDRQPGDLPEREEQVRRLLADARHVEPMPDAVAQRLDLVLAQLVAEGPSGLEEVAPVVDLAARRRRRVGGLLVAAAAVVVAGVGVGAVVRNDESLDSATSASEAASPPQAAQDGTDKDSTLAGGAGEPTLGADAGTGQSSVGPPQAPGAERATAPERLSEKGFGDEVARLQRVPGYPARAGTPVPSSDLTMAESFVCPPTDWGHGRLFAALYDGVPAVLAFRPPSDATQTVELLRCSSGDLLRHDRPPHPLTRGGGESDSPRIGCSQCAGSHPASSS